MTEPTPDELMLKVLGSHNESQARWYVAREVLARGPGGLKARHEMSGLSRPAIPKGIGALRERGTPDDGRAHPTAGRGTEEMGSVPSRIRKSPGRHPGGEYGGRSDEPAAVEE